MSLYPCLQYAIGLTRVEPNCVEDYNIDYSTSHSNLFLDELKGMDLKRMDELGGEQDLWEKMERARQNAILAFKADISHELSKYLEVARKPFSGEIGGTRWAGMLTTSATYKGVKIFSDINGATLKIRGFNLMLTTTETVTLKVYKSMDEDTTDLEELYSISLQSLANRNRYNQLATPIELDLDGEYYFLYQSTGTPLKNKYGCCGFKWCYNSKNPCYSPSKQNWTKWIMASGTTGSSLTGTFTTSMYAYGLSIVGDTLCDTYAMICNDGTDFENDPVAVSVAFAIQYKAGEFMLDYILDSNEVNRFTLLSNESIEANRKYYTERYVACIDYIGSELNQHHNDCWRCKNKSVIRGQLL